MLRRLRDALILNFALSNAHHLLVLMARRLEAHRRADYLAHR